MPTRKKGSARAILLIKSEINVSAANFSKVLGRGVRAPICLGAHSIDGGLADLGLVVQQRRDTVLPCGLSRAQRVR
jgi:hypothetical protein